MVAGVALLTLMLKPVASFGELDIFQDLMNLIMLALPAASIFVSLRSRHPPVAVAHFS